MLCKQQGRLGDIRRLVRGQQHLERLSDPVDDEMDFGAESPGNGPELDLGKGLDRGRPRRAGMGAHDIAHYQTGISPISKMLITAVDGHYRNS